MKRIGKSTKTNSQVWINEQYYVVAQNGIIIGSVRYAFNDGEQWCFAIRLHSGDMPAYGVSEHELGSLFDLQPGEAPWAMPVPQYRDPLADVVHAQALREEHELLIGWDLGAAETSVVTTYYGADIQDMCLLDSECGKARESGAQP